MSNTNYTKKSRIQYFVGAAWPTQASRRDKNSENYVVFSRKWYKKGFTLIELVVTMSLIFLLMGYAWQFYFTGRETMRHEVSQSQMQTDVRMFLDDLSLEIPAVYQFITVNGKAEDIKTFSYYCFTKVETPVETILFNETTGYSNSPKDQFFQALKVSFEWKKETKEITRTQVLGHLHFANTTVDFRDSPSGEYDGTPYAPSTKVVLKNVDNFQIQAYRQRMKTSYAVGELPFTLTEIVSTSPNNATKATFIVLRIGNKVDEKGSKRDEEVDLVTKFYSRYQLAVANYPGFFSVIDRIPEY